MRVEELLNKAAKGLKGYFGKAAGFHEAEAASLTSDAADHTKMADAHKAAGDASTSDADKAFHKAGYAHQMGKAAACGKLCKSHTAMAAHCTSCADAMGGEEAKADTAVDLQKVLAENQTGLAKAVTDSLNTAIDAKLAPVSKGLEKLEAMGARLEKIETDLTKIGNETKESLVKVTGAALIGRDGKEITQTAPAVQSASGGLF